MGTYRTPAPGDHATTGTNDAASAASADIVVGIDGSDSALAAAHWAALRAQAWNAPLRLVHARPIDVLDSLDAGFAQRPLATAAELVHALAPRVPVALSTQYSAPEDMLIAESQWARLIVLGVRGTSDRAEDGPGTVALAVSRHGDCPVVVVRSRAPHAPPPHAGPVVVGVDGSQSAHAALRFAFEFARCSGDPLVAAHTWTDVPLDVPEREWTILPGGPAEIHATKHHELTAWLAPLRAAFPEVPVTERVVHDRPVRGLLSLTNSPDAPPAQLLVVGSRGLAAPHGILLGSVSKSLLHYAECPVAVARPHQLDHAQPARFRTVSTRVGR